MPLPTSGILKVQDIETEFGIGTAVYQLVSANLGPYIGKTPSTLIKFSDFYGATAIPAPTARSANPTLNRIVALSNITSTVASSYSDDGSTWIASATPPASGTWRSVACSPTGRFVAVSSGSADSAYSDDGNTWTTAASLPSSQAWYAIACSRLTGRFVAIVNGSTVSAYSDNGTTWTASPGGLPSASIWNSIACSPTTGRFVALGVGALAYSDDGSTWVSSGSPSGNVPRAIACNFAGRFVASWSLESSARYSDDGTTWSAGSLSYALGTDSYTVATDPITGDFIIAGTNSTPNYSTLSQGGSVTTNPLTLLSVSNSYRAAVAGGSATGNVFVHFQAGNWYKYTVGGSQTSGAIGTLTTVVGATVSPPAFTASFVSYVTTNSIIFIFTPAPGATSYDISGTGITTTNGTGPTIAVKGLSPNTSYGPFTITSKIGAISGKSVSVPSIYTRPSAPTNLVFSNVTQTSFTVSWTAPSGAGALTYTVIRNLNVAVASGLSTTLVDVTGLTQGTQYVTTVYATGPGGRSAGVTQFYPSRQRTLPGPVTSLATSSPTLTSMVLSWVYPTPAGSYTAFDITYTDGTPKSATTTTSPYTITGLLNTNTLYTFTVTTRFYSNVGGQATTSGYTLIDAPTSFTGTAASDTQINFTWVPPFGTASQYTLSGTGVPGLPLTISGPASAYNLTGLSGNTTYPTSGTFSLTATNVTSGLTSAAATCGPFTTPPSAPTSFTGTVISATRIDFTWVAPSGTISSYTLSGAGVPGSPITIAAPATSYSLTGLTSGTSYTFSLTATNSTSGLTSAAASAGPYTTLTSGTVQWVARMGSTGGGETAYMITTDSNNNVYLTGLFSASPMTFYNATGTAFGTTLTGAGGQEAYFVKYNSSGAVQWCARVGSIGADNGWGVATDSSGNLYGCGSYASLATAYNADGTAFTTTIAQVGGTDAFFVKYNTNGVVQWVAKASSAGSDTPRGIAVEKTSGNMYVCGNCTGVLTAYNATQTAFGTTLTQIGLADAFVIKYNTSGTVQWVAKLGSTAGSDIAYSVSLDSSENLYITGQYAGTLLAYNANQTQFGTTLTQITGNDIFIAKYNSAGTVQWLAKMGGSGSDIGYGISVSSAGDVYATGLMTGGMATYNADQTAVGSISGIGLGDAYFVKYTTAGTFQWVGKAGTTAGNDQGNSISFDNNGNLVVVGTYAGTDMTFFNGSTGLAFATTTLSQIGGNDAFVAKLNTSGAIQWVAKAGSAGADNGYTVACDTTGFVYISGIYAGLFTAYSATQTAFGTTLAQLGGNDAYIVKYVL